MKPLFVALALGSALLVSTALRAEQPIAQRSPRFLVHLLDYLAQDYGGAVGPDGKVLSVSEYREQTEFAQSALEAAQGTPELRDAPKITGETRELQSLIAGKAPPARVAALAQEIKSQVIQLTHLDVAPQRWPDLSRGRELFARNCASCHGAGGRGDGPAASALAPPPADFTDPRRMDELSPFRAFNAIRIGVPGTAMAPFAAFSDQDAWSLAFYVISIRHQGEPRAPDQEIQDSALARVATGSDRELLESTPGEPSRKHQVLAALRTHSGNDQTASTLALARASLEDSFGDYRDGRFDAAKQKALSAYLDGVEPAEPKLRANDPSVTAELELKMGDVRSAIEARLPLDQLRNKVDVAEKALDSASVALASQPPSGWFTFLVAAGILLREGFEAVIILIALLAVIRASGSRRAALWVHAGWIAALALGAAAWVFSGWLMGISGAGRELMEGTTSLLAVLVLLYMGFWLHSRTELTRWRKFINIQVKSALEGSNLLGIAAISFMAVFREAFETVLFLRAVWLEGGPGTGSALAAGVACSLAALLAISWALLKYSARIPIAKVFSASSVMMAILAVILTGKGLHSLQETGLLSITPSPLALHWDLLGFYPTHETLIPQIAVLALVVVLWKLGKKAPVRSGTA